MSAEPASLHMRIGDNANQERMLNMLTFVGEHDRLAIGVAHWRIAQRYCRILVKCIGTSPGGVDSDVELGVTGTSSDPSINTVLVLTASQAYKTVLVCKFEVQ